MKKEMGIPARLFGFLVILMLIISSLAFYLNHPDFGSKILSLVLWLSVTNLVFYALEIINEKN